MHPFVLHHPHRGHQLPRLPFAGGPKRRNIRLSQHCFAGDHLRHCPRSARSKSSVGIVSTDQRVVRPRVGRPVVVGAVPWRVPASFFLRGRGGVGGGIAARRRRGLRLRHGEDADVGRARSSSDGVAERGVTTSSQASPVSLPRAFVFVVIDFRVHRTPSLTLFRFFSVVQC